jgi:hypothetical protein
MRIVTFEQKGIVVIELVEVGRHDIEPFLDIPVAHVRVHPPLGGTDLLEDASAFGIGARRLLASARCAEWQQ